MLLSGAPDNGPPVRDPILETLTMDLGGATGTGRAGCLFSYTCFTSGQSYVCLGREAILRMCIARFFPWETKVSVQGYLQGWSCDFSEAGQDYPRKIPLSVCSWHFSTGTGLAHPLLTKSAFPAAALEPRIWLPRPSTPALIFTHFIHPHCSFSTQWQPRKCLLDFNSDRGETGLHIPKVFSVTEETNLMPPLIYLPNHTWHSSNAIKGGIFNKYHLQGQQAALQSLPLKASSSCGLQEWSLVYQKVQQFLRAFS